MAPDALLFERLALAVAFAVSLAGIAGAWASSNAAKRLASLIIALIGSIIAAAVLDAPASALIAGAAVAFALTAVGAAVIVRVQEDYGGIEVADMDAADADSDAQEPAA
jgi:hypothetical protein